MSTNLARSSSSDTSNDFIPEPRYDWTQIREFRFEGDFCYARVQWRGCAPPQDTWEEISRLFENAGHLIPPGYVGPTTESLYDHSYAFSAVLTIVDRFLEYLQSTSSARYPEWRIVYQRVDDYLIRLRKEMEKKRGANVSPLHKQPIATTLPTFSPSLDESQKEGAVIEHIAAITSSLHRWHEQVDAKQMTAPMLRFIDHARGVNGAYNGLVDGKLELHHPMAMLAVGTDCLRGRRFEDQCWVNAKHIGYAAVLARKCTNLGNSSPLSLAPDLPYLSYSIPERAFSKSKGDDTHQQNVRMKDSVDYGLLKDVSYSAKNRQYTVHPMKADSWGVIDYEQSVDLAVRTLEREMAHWAKDGLMGERLATLQKLLDGIDDFPQETVENSNFVTARRAVSAVYNAYGHLDGPECSNARTLLTRLRTCFCMSILSSRPDLYAMLSAAYVFEAWDEFRSKPPAAKYEIHKWVLSEITIWSYTAMQCSLEGYHIVSHTATYPADWLKLPHPDPALPRLTVEDKVIGSIKYTVLLSQFSCNKVGCSDIVTCTYTRDDIAESEVALLEVLRRFKFGTGTRDRRELLGL
ncbi:hypothetical protein CI109_103872 [Kwoniella shandongensis]|uniref:Uncharacterized protein n=1 Tax=Kwoniella shandongensis TaxID=1734106 RepID=A0AAJ8LK76_9TREE